METMRIEVFEDFPQKSLYFDFRCAKNQRHFILKLPFLVRLAFDIYRSNQKRKKNESTKIKHNYLSSALCS